MESTNNSNSFDTPTSSDTLVILLTNISIFISSGILAYIALTNFVSAEVLYTALLQSLVVFFMISYLIFRFFRVYRPEDMSLFESKYALYAIVISASVLVLVLYVYDVPNFGLMAWLIGVIVSGGYMNVLYGSIFGEV